MFTFAILTGIFSYIIFSLGIFGFLYKQILIILSLIYIILSVGILIKNLLNNKNEILHLVQNDKVIILSLSLLILQQLVNLIGALGPELSFDALWYHLTLPKIYLLNHKIFFIPGGLFYYSVMPKFTEMIYAAFISFGSEIYAKLFHFIFGLLTILVIYKIGRLYLPKKLSIIACIIFSSSLAFDWLQITAYVDLIRTFFEVLSFYYLLHFAKNRNVIDLMKSSILTGLAISTKLISVFDLVGINIFLIIFYVKNSYQSKFVTKNLLLYNLVVFLIPLPWFIFSYISTGNPMYPFLTKLYPSGYSWSIFNPLFFIEITWKIFTASPDPLSPIFLIFIPLVFINIKKFKEGKFYLLLLSIIIYFSWYFTPLTGGGRFILPFTGIFSIVCAILIDFYKKQKFETTVLITVVILAIIISIIFRFGANYKYLPVILAKETKVEFLCKNLNLNFGDFYDCANFFKNHIKVKDKVLLIGFHNEYYVDFPFIDQSFLKPSDKFNYIATQNSNLPNKYKNWRIIYQNNVTHVKLYKK